MSQSNTIYPQQITTGIVKINPIELRHRRSAALTRNKKSFPGGDDINNFITHEGDIILSNKADYNQGGHPDGQYGIPSFNGDNYDDKKTSEAVMDGYNVVGVSQAKYNPKKDPESGFTVTLHGPRTITNTGNKDIEPGQKIRVTAPPLSSDLSKRYNNNRKGNRHQILPVVLPYNPADVGPTLEAVLYVALTSKNNGGSLDLTARDLEKKDITDLQRLGYAFLKYTGADKDKNKIENDYGFTLANGWDNNADDNKKKNRKKLEDMLKFCNMFFHQTTKHVIGTSLSRSSPGDKLAIFFTGHY